MNEFKLVNVVEVNMWGVVTYSDNSKMIFKPRSPEFKEAIDCLKSGKGCIIPI
jgi:hypothetical protein